MLYYFELHAGVCWKFVRGPHLSHSRSQSFFLLSVSLFLFGISLFLTTLSLFDLLSPSQCLLLFRRLRSATMAELTSSAFPGLHLKGRWIATSSPWRTETGPSTLLWCPSLVLNVSSSRWCLDVSTTSPSPHAVANMRITPWCRNAHVGHTISVKKMLHFVLPFVWPSGHSNSVC